MDPSRDRGADIQRASVGEAVNAISLHIRAPEWPCVHLWRYGETDHWKLNALVSLGLVALSFTVSVEHGPFKETCIGPKPTRSPLAAIGVHLRNEWEPIGPERKTRSSVRSSGWDHRAYGTDKLIFDVEWETRAGPLQR